MNSFRSVERAIEYEIERQAAALDAGEPLVQETRGWSDDRGETYRMRSKETSDDYRYFPEPDLPPLHVDPAWLETLASRSAGAAGGPPDALPGRRRASGRTTPAVLTSDPDATALFEATLAADPSLAPKSVANWVTGEYLRLRNTAAADTRSQVDGGRARGDRPTRSRTGRSRARTPRRSSRPTSRRGEAAAVDHRGPRLSPDHRHGRRRRGRRRRPRREPGRGRRLPGRQGPGGRLPRRAR